MSYPGNSRHQAMLEAIVSFYQGDARIRAVLLFGSLARGNWDDFSDIDLDVIVADGVAIDAHQELRRLCGAFLPLGEKLALIVPDDDDAGDAVFESLAQMSVRYHTLDTTKPAIVDDLLILAGELDDAAIRAAAERNRHPADSHGDLQSLLDRCIYYLPVAAIALQRGYFWDTLEILQRMRNLLLEIYTHARGSFRVYHFFDRQAPVELSALLKATLPQDTLDAEGAAFVRMMDLLEHKLDMLSDGQLSLSKSQSKVIEEVRRVVSFANSGDESARR